MCLEIDWEKRIGSILRIKDTLKKVKDLVGEDLQESYLIQLLKALQRPISTQVLDLRS